MFATIYRLTRTATSGETLRNWRCNPNYLWAIKQVLDAIEFGDIDDAREKLRLSSA